MLLARSPDEVTVVQRAGHRDDIDTIKDLHRWS